MKWATLASAATLLALVLISAGPSFGWFELAPRLQAALGAARLIAVGGLIIGVTRQLGMPWKHVGLLLGGCGLLLALALPGILALGQRGLPSAEALYVRNCGTCHGDFGQGTGLGPALNDATWLHGQGSLEDIDAVVREGVPGTSMAGWEGLLSEEDRLAISVYVFGLQLAEQ